MSSSFMHYSRDHKFILKEWLDLNEVLNTERFKDGYSVDDIDFILDNALKGAKEVIAPTIQDSDQIGAKYENGKVTTPASTKEAYFFIQNNGFCASNYDPHDPSAVPLCVLWSMLEYIIGANPSLGTLYLATGGAATLIEDFGSEELKKTYLPKMYSGQWAGTMALTEPNAGSEVGNITTRAIPTDKPGVYKIKGSKCFISGGDQDITENIIHLALARIEGARKGTAGISLFVIPKYLPDENGNPGKFNDVHCAGIEHKLGLHGNPTCVMNFGENDDCIGFLVGDPPGEDGVGQGMAQMFNMMNEERLMTGLSATALAAVAYHNAADYARQRIQGKATADPKGGQVPIIKHEDIRRMLMFQKSMIEAFRAMAISTFYMVDIKKNSSDPDKVQWASNISDVNIPLVKAFCSDYALECISNALQIYGGYGFSEEYPIAELYRDARIYPIWEGTNYIQAMDLVGRKMTMKKGQVFADWLKHIDDFVQANSSNPDLAREFALMKKARQQYDEILGVINTWRSEGNESLLKLFATRILHATGKLYAAKLLLEMALIAQQKLAAMEKDHYDYAFYQGKVASARFFVRNILPEVGALVDIMKEQDCSAIEVDEAALGIIG
ncbi:MAG TPA: acyl-CoA dehydrogenase [Syntrophomonadaceae bacterium]|nr:acyl-CoA dehydrogenase [Syntrophomonadaceae bacterium]HPU49634.1 acyl-CoA dehydrogenase [Syntrophomonadaceae bacterium]